MSSSLRCLFLYTLGKDSCNGFSLWQELARLIATSSSVAGRPKDPVDRWCELFAASVLLPRAARERFLAEDAKSRVTDLGVESALATRGRVSLRAATIRVIELGLADWELYDQIPPATVSNPGQLALKAT